MKGFIGIKTPDEYTVDKLYELIEREGNFALPYELIGNGKMQRIQFPLGGNNVIQIIAGKKTINISTTKGSMTKDLGLSAITGGWNSVFDSSKKKNQDILEDIAAEIRRVTGGK